MGVSCGPKLRAGDGKDQDAKKVTGGLILIEGRKIEEIWVERSHFSDNHLHN